MRTHILVLCQYILVHIFRQHFDKLPMFFGLLGSTIYQSDICTHQLVHTFAYSSGNILRYRDKHNLLYDFHNHDDMLKPEFKI